MQMIDEGWINNLLFYEKWKVRRKPVCFNKRLAKKGAPGMEEQGRNINFIGDKQFPRSSARGTLCRSASLPLATRLRPCD